MADDTKLPPSPPPGDPNLPEPATVPPPDTAGPNSSGGASFHIGDEFGTAKRNLPPARIVLIGIALLAVVGAIVSFTQRAKPQGAGGITAVADAEVPNQSMVLVAIQLDLRNTGEKSLYVHTLKASVETGSGTLTDDSPVSQVDYERYLQAFPALRSAADAGSAALVPETKIPPGQEIHRSIIVGFPTTHDAFQNRKSLTVSIQPYDQPLPIVLKK